MKTKYLALIALALSSFYSHGQELALVIDDGKVGYIDTSGQYALQTDFEKAASFSNGLAAAKEGKKWGFIDITGNWAIEPQYDKVKAFNTGLALVLKDDQWNYIQTSGEILEVDPPDKYLDFKDGVAIYRKGEKIGLLGSDGKLILEPTYDEIKKFWDGHAKFRKGEDNWGLLNYKGEVIIPAEYEKIGAYNKNGVWGKKGNDLGVFSDGKFTAIPGIDKIWDFRSSSTLTYAKKGDKVGFVDNKGNWVIEPSFDAVRAFSNGMAPVRRDKKWGYINEKGEQVIDFQYKDAETFSADGLAPVKEKMWGFVDKSGKLVIPMEYDISAGFSFLQKNAQKGFNNGIARVKTKKGWGFINTKGEVLGDKWHKNAENFADVN